MASDERVAKVFLLISMLLHLILLVPLPFFQQQDKSPEPETKLRVRYVVRMPHPSRTPTSAALIKPPPRTETSSMAATVQPRTPQPLKPLQSHPEPMATSSLPVPQRQAIEPKHPERRLPRQAANFKPQVAAARRQKPPTVLQAAPAPAMPSAVEPVDRSGSRQPITSWQQVKSPQPSSGSPGKDDPLATYLAEVRAAIDRHKRYPAAARRAGITGSVVLQFVILSDGRVIEPSVAETNGHSAFGAAALDSLRRASPMPPFPEEIARDRLMVRVPISYKLTE